MMRRISVEKTDEISLLQAALPFILLVFFLFWVISC